MRLSPSRSLLLAGDLRGCPWCAATPATARRRPAAGATASGDRRAHRPKSIGPTSAASRSAPTTSPTRPTRRFTMLLGVLRQAADRVPAGAPGRLRLRRQQDRRGLRRQHQDRQGRAQASTSATTSPAPPTPTASSTSRRPTAHLTALDPLTGKTKWTFKSDAELESSPLVAEGKVYLGSDDGHFYATRRRRRGKLLARSSSATTSRRARRSTTGRSTSATTRATVWALDADNGDKKWNTDTTNDFARAAPAASTPHLRSRSATSTRRATTARSTRSTHRPASSPGSSQPRTRSTRSPAAAEVPGTKPSIYIGSYNHQLYALNAATGRSAGATTSAASSPARRPSSARRSTPRASRPSRRSGSTRTPARRSSSGARPASPP